MNKKISSPMAIGIIVFLAVLVGGIVVWQYLGMSRIETSEFKPAEKVQPADETAKFLPVNKELLNYIKNSEYTLSGGETVKLTNGYWEKEKRLGFYSAEINNITIGDLNEDKREDAAVILIDRAGGSGAYFRIFGIITQDGKFSKTEPISIDDRAIINSISIDFGIITLDAIVHGPWDSMAEPTLKKIFRYKIEGNKLVEISGDETLESEIIKEFSYVKDDEKFFVTKKEFRILDYFKISELEDNHEECCFFSDAWGNSKNVGEFTEYEKETYDFYNCEKIKDKEYYEDLLSNFSIDDKGIEYEFHNIMEPEKYNIWIVTIIPNKIGYTNKEDFMIDFALCYAGGQRYPELISENYLLFINSCGSGALGEGCQDIQELVEPTIRLK